ncbi:BREX-1 system adenine-specific DNA-methyltransferase PglX [Fusobacterium sp. PH5-44]|uniref:BREX-1 system adenine-specific DNA-methyltransferase PglX n=1 Tax=unclassified Fusobacterium TaxID=2648384 RepID=UPI003D231F03
MDKAQLKNFAINARKDLIEKMKVRLNVLGITKDGPNNAKIIGDDVEINGELYPKKSYDSLLAKYKHLGYEQLIEESAYTWFNRLTALAFMEVNGYIDEKMIFSNGTKLDPGILDNYIEADFFERLSSQEKEKLHKLKDENTSVSIEKMYSLLIEEKSHELSKIMPFMFTPKGGYSDILFPSGLLMVGSGLVRLREIMEKSIEDISIDGESKKKGVPIEIIGWLYQFYNSEKKDEAEKKTKKTKNDVPALTQLFTPGWIVKYMVENSLGKLAMESLGISDKLRKKWKYHLESEKEDSTEKLKVEDVKILDPAMGSGHILAYSFDVLFDTYLDLGWTTKDAVLSIIKNNIFGLDIDERASQLASFSIFMKGREKFSRLFKELERMSESKELQVNTLVIEESNSISPRMRKFISDNKAKNVEMLVNNFENAKEYGSIIKLDEIDIEELQKELGELYNLYSGQINLFDDGKVLDGNIEEDLREIEKLVQQQKIMQRKYDVTIANPPYMGTKKYSAKLKKYVEDNYKDSKGDMFAVFIEVCNNFTKADRYTSMVTMHSWMFLSSFELLRKSLIDSVEIQSLNHLGTRAFPEIGGEVVQTVAWVSKKRLPERKGKYIRLINFNNTEWKEKEFLNDENHYEANQKDFEKIPGSPIAYWVSDKVREMFGKNKKLGEVGDAKQGLATADNDRFLRRWYEVSNSKTGYGMSNSIETLESGIKWFPYNKGGEKRKWYGNQEYLVNWENDGHEIKNFKNSVVRNSTYYFRESISWGLITSASSSFRYFPNGFIYDVGGMSYFPDKDIFNYLGILNTKTYSELTKIINPTVNLQIGDVAALPAIDIKNSDFNNLVENNINIAKEEWDSRETSWNFEELSLINGTDLQSTYDNYCKHWTDQFVQMHRNETKLNQLFIEIYGLEDEMDEFVSFDDITLLKKEVEIEDILTPAFPKEEIKEKEKTSEGYLYNRGTRLKFNKSELIKQFLSYAVGCVVGRYSIDKIGLIMANSDDILEITTEKILVKSIDGELRHEIKNPKFIPDEYGIIPITQENVFTNDIVKKIKEFVEAVYGKESLEDNLDFIADALGKKNNETSEDVVRNYFINEFYKDHLQRYQKRPIYWMVNSGKKNGFSALIYLHRYEENTIARVRNDYLLKYQEVLENIRDHNEKKIADKEISPKEKKETERKLKELNAYLVEIRDFANEVKHISEQKIKLDLDDGVKVNYSKFGKILAEIK